MATNPGKLEVEVHVLVVEHNDGGGEDPAVFVGSLASIRRDALVHLRNLPSEMIRDEGEAVIAPVRNVSADVIYDEWPDEMVIEVLDAFHEATTAPWVSEFVRLVTFDVTVAR